MKLKNDIYVYEWTNPYENNCNSYFIGGNVQVLIDPGLTGYVPNLLDQMSADGIKKEDIHYVINTHSHPDHFQGSEVFDQEKIKVGLHTKEIEFLKGAGGELYSLFGINVPRMNVNFPLEEGDMVLGDQTFKIILAPGHSPGRSVFMAGAKSFILRRCSFRPKRRAHRFSRRQRRYFKEKHPCIFQT